MTQPRRGRSRIQLPQTALIFAALGEPIRLKMVARLCDSGPLSIARLTEGTEVSRQAITKHLHMLEGAGLVSSGRMGRERVWELQATRLKEARGYLDSISNQWDEAIGRLSRLVEGEG